MEPNTETTGGAPETPQAPPEETPANVTPEELEEAKRLLQQAAATGGAGVSPAALEAAQARLTAFAQGRTQAAENLIEGGVLGWDAPPILPWSKEIDAPIGEVRKQLALYFPDWAVAVWPTAVPAQVIEALKADEARPENVRLVELSKLHTIQIECTWMPDMKVQRRLAQGATLEDVKGPKVHQFIAPPFTCTGPPVFQELANHIGAALVEHGAIQRDPAEVLAERKQDEIDEARRVLKEHGVSDESAAAGPSAPAYSSGPAPKEPEPMTLEKWEAMPEADKMRWQKEWQAWEAYRSPGPPPASDGPGGRNYTATWERIAPGSAPFVPPDAYVPGREQVRPRGRPRGIFGPNDARPWEGHWYVHEHDEAPEPEYTTDPEVAMIEHLMASFQGWGRQDIARVLDYVKARLVG